METKIATNIETKIFYSIIKFLEKSGWKLIFEYDVFDKGIDFDLYQFTKNNEQILLAWDNWFEGEIKATTKTLDEIADHFRFTLKFGEPEHLQKTNIIEEMKILLKFRK